MNSKENNKEKEKEKEKEKGKEFKHLDWGYCDK